MRNIIILFCSMMIVSHLFAQQDQLTIIRHGVDKRIVDVAARARSVVGVSASDLEGLNHFGLNDTLTFPQASAIKVTILMEVFKQAHEGKIKLTDRRTIEHAKTVEGGILNAFGDGQSQVSIHDLCVMMIVLSDNSAANMLIDLVGMQNVNATLRSLGLTRTRLQRKMMDIKASIRGDENISTPSEAAMIMKHLAMGEFIDRETSDAILEILSLPREGSGNIAGSLPEDVPVAYKQGEILPAVATEWALVRLKGHPYVIVVMSNYGLGDDAAVATKEISKVVYEYFWRLARSTPHGTYSDPALWK
jgi:beta-lactamase class A